ncbi:hypothetical protein WJX73_005208 [Symbiochloris irregularis]|uniref:LysM domain-containing protein n=1 Tax=Symbiochloris irregularis TaxID=706552 RepID=A0AAW1P0D8_9CHLO
MSHCEDAQLACGLDQLSRELLTLVFSKFSTADVARARAVCKTWQLVLDDSMVRRDIFLRFWGLSRLVSEPRSPAFYLEATLSHFAFKHDCQPRDSLTGIAVKYNVGVHELKRLNNLMTDFSLHARSHVHIPVCSRKQVEGRVGHFTLDPIACRHLVLLSEDENKPADAPAVVQTPADADASEEELWRDRLTSMVGRGLRISKDTARYYLNQAHGDVKTAFALYEDDVDWDVHFGSKLRVD